MFRASGRSEFEALLRAAESAAVDWRGEGADEDGNTLAGYRDRADKAFALGKAFVRDDPDAVAHAATVSSFISRRLGQWPAAQRALEGASELLDAAIGKEAPASLRASLRVVDLLLVREHFEQALGVIADRHLFAPPGGGERFALELRRVRALSGVGRHELALAAAHATFRSACEVFGDGSRAAFLGARRLAMAMTAANSDLDLALTLADRAVPPEPRSPPEIEDFIDGAITALRVLLKRGDAPRAVQFAEFARAAINRHRGAIGAAGELELELWAVQAEALGAVGAVQEATELYRKAIAQFELADRKTAPALIALHEGLARSLPTTAAAAASAARLRAAALRAAITGAAGSAAPPAPEPVSPSAVKLSTEIVGTWPRRAMTGVVVVSNADDKALERVVAYLSRPAAGFGPIRVVQKEPGDRVLVLDGWEDPFEEKRAQRNRGFVARVADMLKGANSALRDAGREERVRLVPWWSVDDLLPVPYWEWPSGLQQKLRSQLFPTLPGRTAAEATWLGTGIVGSADGGVDEVSPRLQLEFVEGKGIAFRGYGPAQQLDAWFNAFAKATALFPPRLYTPLSPPPGRDF